MRNHDLDNQVPDYKFYGNYRGIVEDDEDPFQAGRVKVRVFGMFDELPIEALPWAQYADPFMGGAANAGGIWVPDKGTHVWVFFENGEHDQPVYFAGAPARVHFPQQATKSDQPSSRSRGDIKYPRNKAFRSRSGHVIELDDTEGNSRIRISHKSGTQQIIFDNGDVYERVVGNKTSVVYGDSFEYVKGNKILSALSNVDIRSTRMDLNSSAPTTED